MPKFNIHLKNACNYKDQILKFWEDYLPGTPAGRFDWLQNNPAGPAIWYFAFDAEKEKLAGVVSVMPKDFYVKGERVRAGIVGDFMLHEKYRVFGPALDLLKAVIKTVDDGIFDFVYTLPNNKSIKLIERAGFGCLFNFYSMIRPLHVDYVLKQYVGSRLSHIIDRPLFFFLKSFSRDSFSIDIGSFEELDWQEKPINDYFQMEIKSKSDFLVGEKTIDYLQWRYGSNPEHKFKIINYINKKNKQILGYFVFTIIEDRFIVYEIICIEDRYIFSIMRKIKNIAIDNSCRAVYFSSNLKRNLKPNLNTCLYMNTGCRSGVYAYPVMKEYYKNWEFSPGDRNI